MSQRFHLRNPAQALIEELAFQISIRRKPPLSAEQEAAGFSPESYTTWRSQGLGRAFARHFPQDEIAGKRVLDFGCGFGALSRLAVELGASEAIGVDIDPSSIEQARRQPHSRITFQLEPDPGKISLPSGSVDVVLSFWMLEHVMTYEASMHEWARVLAPGGKVLILWSVWRHPYGHHLHTIVPLPWIHLLLGPASLYRVAARVYESPTFRPRWWHFDQNGVRKPNFYRGGDHFSDLNRLTTARFEATARRAEFTIVRREARCGNSRIRRALASIHPLQDFICSHFVYELQKPRFERDVGQAAQLPIHRH